MRGDLIPTIEGEPTCGLYIIGNGLTLGWLYDVLRESDKADRWNTQRPLSWNVPSPMDRRRPLLADLARFEAVRSGIYRRHGLQNDFDLFKILATIKPGSRDYLGQLDYLGRLEGEHFLAIAFSEFQIWLDRQYEKLISRTKRWPLAKMINEINREDVSLFVSFNYDLLLERLINLAGFNYGRFGLQEEKGIFVLKPHGSIDFELKLNSPPRNSSYPFVNVYFHNNLPIFRLERQDWTKPRTQPGLVLPNELSQQMGMRWIGPGYGFVDSLKPYIRRVFIVGHSYSVMDRKEIGGLLKGISRNSIAYIVNPYPPKELVDHLLEAGIAKVILINVAGDRLEELAKRYREYLPGGGETKQQVITGKWDWTPEGEGETM